MRHPAFTNLTAELSWTRYIGETHLLPHLFQYSVGPPSCPMGQASVELLSICQRELNGLNCCCCQMPSGTCGRIDLLLPSLRSINGYATLSFVAAGSHYNWDSGFSVILREPTPISCYFEGIDAMRYYTLAHRWSSKNPKKPVVCLLSASSCPSDWQLVLQHVDKREGSLKQYLNIADGE